MRLACIDIGTNTTRLLVAEPDGGGLCEVLAERAFTDLGDVRRTGEIGAERIAAVAAAVAAHVERARASGTSSIHIVATAGVRDAADRAALLAAVAAVSGVTPVLLSGEQEARLTFVGATAGLAPAAPDPVGVIDVGGGSTELAVGTPGAGAQWWVSLPLGSAVLTAEVLRSDPPTTVQVQAAERFVADRIGGVDPPPCTRALAVGGSATSLARLAGTLLGADALQLALERLLTAPSGVLAPRLALDPRRVRLLPAGIIMLRGAALALGVWPSISMGGLREGVILEQLGGGAGDRPRDHAL